MKTTMKMISAAAVMAMAMGSQSAMAATESGSLGVSATVVNACAIGTGTLAFGSTLSLAVNIDGTAGTTSNTDVNSTDVEIICTNGASATVTSDLGQNALESVKQMKSGSDLLAYELYTDSAGGTVLNATNGITYTGTGASENLTIYGRIAAAALAAAKKGTYSDTVALTVTYTP